MTVCQSINVTLTVCMCVFTVVRGSVRFCVSVHPHRSHVMWGSPCKMLAYCGMHAAGQCRHLMPNLCALPLVVMLACCDSADSYLVDSTCNNCSLRYRLYT